MFLNILSGKRDSNSRPRPWQGRALPTELFPSKDACSIKFINFCTPLNAVAKVQLFFKSASICLKKNHSLFLFFLFSTHPVTIILITETTVIFQSSVAMQHRDVRMADAIEHIGFNRSIMYHVFKNNPVARARGWPKRHAPM